ncbi:hypothetical protein LCGC14_1448520 [marine sediment metagenome]|uniref:Uncharacterized protein n=1 Tax=marine sediment metagenome TaxID=412755 RepID=A0A0F9K4R9_9ZZZZ
MKEIKFVAVLSLQETTNSWDLNPTDKYSRKFVPDNTKHNHLSFSKVLHNFKDEDHLEIRIRKVKKK